MDDATGRAMYKTAGELGMPVGFMLFKGLHLHLPEVTALLDSHPETPAVIDHWGFFHQDGRDVEEAWAQLLALAKYPQVCAGGWVGGWVGGWMDGWTGGWVDGWMSGWVHR
jgi:predicted TIM-barrel fold metal-dependent hydrolase